MDVGLPKQTASFHSRFSGTRRAIGGVTYRLDVGASGAMLNGFIVHTVLLQICARTHLEILKDGWDRGNGKRCN